ncbi:hypothetical protein [Bacillus suaedae]|uniref:Uncharacterized protein n=1 Tax=Halalkalibacter suaedae TaxID=2822140 RepID=A0A940WYG6_9BACI|nr:hypothetical protein [Bacillus suaedae]MBP3953092.1 hypothetical protein [Bacillus suaedae]
MGNFGVYVLALIVLTFIVFTFGAFLLGGSSSPYTDFILTFIAVYLVTSKFKIKKDESS